MPDQTELWNKRREVLQAALAKAALDLFAHTGSTGFTVPIKGTTPPLIISCGEHLPESLEAAAEPAFTTIEQHWNHFLERDMPPNAPDVQVFMMKQAFAAGAISGVALALRCFPELSVIDKPKIDGHVADIRALNKEAQREYGGPRG